MAMAFLFRKLQSGLIFYFNESINWVEYMTINNIYQALSILHALDETT